MQTAVTTRSAILQAARELLLEEGYAGLSTRKVAEGAAVPLSQVHYHFGSKQRMILSLLEDENARLLARQERLYGQDVPLSKRYEQACDYLEDDLESGYVRVLQEMIAAGWSNPEIGKAIHEVLRGWTGLLTEVSREAEQRFGQLGPFSPEEVATLISASFIGAEAFLLLGFERQELPIRSALRRVAEVIRNLEREAG